MFRDFWNCELGFDLGHVNEIQERNELTLFMYYCKLLRKLWLYEVEWLFWILQEWFGGPLGQMWLRVFMIIHDLSVFMS